MKRQQLIRLPLVEMGDAERLAAIFHQFSVSPGNYRYFNL